MFNFMIVLARDSTRRKLNINHPIWVYDYSPNSTRSSKREKTTKKKSNQHRTTYELPKSKWNKMKHSPKIMYFDNVSSLKLLFSKYFCNIFYFKSQILSKYYIVTMWALINNIELHRRPGICWRQSKNNRDATGRTNDKTFATNCNT